jgi:anti-sigma factor RsiW
MTISHVIRLACREVVEHITDLLAGELSADDAIRLEQHLLVCPPCTLHIEQVRTTIALAAETRAPAAPVPDDALAMFRRWKAKP